MLIDRGEAIMEQVTTRSFAGIDLGRTALSLSIYDEAKKEMEEKNFPVDEDRADDYIRAGLDRLSAYLQEKGLSPEDFTDVVFCMEKTDEESRKKLREELPENWVLRHGCHVISRFRAFAEYVFRQEKMVWDRNTLLLDYTDDTLHCVLIDQIRPSRQKAYRGRMQEIDLLKEGIFQGAPDQDQAFSKMIRQFLAKNPTNIVFLTGEGFEGSWMKRTLNCLCAGRRVFLGQNIYASGACLLASGPLALMEEGMILLDGPDMVCHTVGIVTSEGGQARYVPVTSIGKEWYNTSGRLDVILDKSSRLEFFFHNTLENEMEGSACEISNLPQRPAKTTRIRVRVVFSSRMEGTILMEDMGFGQISPGTGRITVFPFTLIS